MFLSARGSQIQGLSPKSMHKPLYVFIFVACLAFFVKVLRVIDTKLGT
jgi:hypothetical protein